MDIVRFILWTFSMFIIFLILIVLLKLGLVRFFNKILPFSFLRKSYDGSLNINGLTYQGQCFWIFIISLTMSISFLFLDENYWINIGAFLGTLIPGVMLLLRIRTFNDNNILSETNIGYNPLNSYIFSWLCGIFGFIIGFSRFYYMDVPLYAPIIVIMAALVSCLIQCFLIILTGLYLMM